jgi:hypothetical protein
MWRLRASRRYVRTREYLRVQEHFTINAPLSATDLKQEAAHDLLRLIQVYVSMSFD